MNITDQIIESIREIKDFPKQGIYFKDITPILKKPDLCKAIANNICDKVSVLKPDAVVGIESRGFWFGMLISQELNIPFVPIRKLGKLPYETHTYTYELEYGKATMEIHTDALRKGAKVIVHDDLLATGGTASAAAELIKMQGAEVAAFAFVVDLTFLGGKEKIRKYSENVISLVDY
ncbi:MAG: adenine phosphoribosyltransferase [Bacteroidota bacterium]|nr:adenine phosphoribosyltransferase [Bacteroidota bacterium]